MATLSANRNIVGAMAARISTCASHNVHKHSALHCNWLDESLHAGCSAFQPAAPEDRSDVWAFDLHIDYMFFLYNYILPSGP